MALALGRYYQHSFNSHPNITLACANGSLSSVGDVVAQLTQHFMESRKKKSDPPLFRYDFSRTTRFFLFGVAMGPAIGKWNKFLEFRFPLRPRPSAPVSTTALAKRVISDQLLMAPLGIALFLGSMGLMEGRSKAQIKEKYSDLYVPALSTNWKVWPLAQLINFRYMPLPYRVPFSQTCGVFWTLYLSLLNAREDEIQDQASPRKIH